MAKLLCCDLDGTLFYPKGVKSCVSKKNVKFLQDFIDAGNRLVLVTSRSRQFLEKLKKEIKRPFDYMPCSSAEIYVNEERVREAAIDRESLLDVMNFLDETHRPIAYMMTTEKYPCLIKQNSPVGKLLFFFYKVYYAFQGVYQEPYLFDNDVFDEELKNGRIYKVMVFYGLGKNKKIISKELNKILREKHPNIESSWSLIVNELTAKGCSKAEGIEFYCKHQNISRDDVYVIGDSGNDISMFEKFYEHSYVMQHAYPSVKKYAKYSVPSVFKLRKFVLEGEN